MIENIAVTLRLVSYVGYAIFAAGAIIGIVAAVAQWREATAKEAVSQVGNWRDRARYLFDRGVRIQDGAALERPRPALPDAARLWAALQALVLVAGDEISGVIQRLESHQHTDARDRTALKTLRQAIASAQSILDQERPALPAEQGANLSSRVATAERGGDVADASVGSVPLRYDEKMAPVGLPPWEVERTYTRPMASTDNWGPGPYFVVRREPGEWCACSLVEERANAVRDALNALASGAALPPQTRTPPPSLLDVDALTLQDLHEIAAAGQQAGGAMTQWPSVLRKLLKRIAVDQGGVSSLRAPQGGLPDATILGASPAVTRVELIDHRHGAPRAQRGRVFVAMDASVALSYQDGGRTLKIFVADRAGSGAETPPQPETP